MRMQYSTDNGVKLIPPREITRAVEQPRGEAPFVGFNIQCTTYCSVVENRISWKRKDKR